MRINVLSREAITTHNKAVAVGQIGDAAVVALVDDYGNDSAGNPVQHWNLHADIGGGVFRTLTQKSARPTAEEIAALGARFEELGFTADSAGIRAWLIANLRDQWDTARAIDGAEVPFGCTRFVMTYLKIVDGPTWDARRAEDAGVRAMRDADRARETEARRARETAAALADVNATAELLAAGFSAKITAVVAAVKHHKIDAHPRTLSALAAGRRTEGVATLLRQIADLAPSRVAAAAAADEAIEAENRAAGFDASALFRRPA